LILGQARHDSQRGSTNGCHAVPRSGISYFPYHHGMTTCHPALERRSELLGVYRGYAKLSFKTGETHARVDQEQLPPLRSARRFDDRRLEGLFGFFHPGLQGQGGAPAHGAAFCDQLHRPPAPCVFGRRSGVMLGDSAAQPAGGAAIESPIGAEEKIYAPIIFPQGHDRLYAGPPLPQIITIPARLTHGWRSMDAPPPSNGRTRRIPFSR